MTDYKPVLAMYDIRGKQEFIFRTNRIKEIVGASWLIRDLFKDYLYPAAARLNDSGKGIYSYKSDENESGHRTAFSEKSFREHIEEGYLGEVIYEGGGNFILLFKNAKIFRDVTYAFTKELLRNIGTLRVTGTYIENVNFEDYKGDRIRLSERHRINGAQESNIMPWSCLPIVQVDRKTSMPLVDKSPTAKSPTAKSPTANSTAAKSPASNFYDNEKHSLESLSKLAKYHSEIERMKSDKYRASLTEMERKFYTSNENKLDHLVTEKGRDSRIAVLYIDGNNMGAKVQNIVEGKKTYEECVNALRSFSDDIQRIYVDDGIRRVMSSMKNDGRSYRIIVSAGDEVNFIVNAHDAFDCARLYLGGLMKEKDASACAGIAVFNSHAPYSDAYRIAEEACETGKKKMKDLKMNRACFVDYHFCQGAVGVSLERIRKEECGEVISKPWLMYTTDKPSVYEKKTTEWKDAERVIKILRVFGRSNVKGLMQASLSSKVDLEMELNRMYAHLSAKKKTEEFEKEWAWLKARSDKRELIYDIVAGFDLWFKDMKLDQDDSEVE